ncbi:putative small GTP-binding protein [Helianthus debilis subsp. tardiflorus]
MGKKKVQPQAEPVTVADEDAAKKKVVLEEKPVEEELKGKVKKVPKHVREIQERLARLREAQEKKEREEEEDKLRKEEEERLRKEEEERQAEETKRLKKEREKEKKLKLKHEGKLLTAKQKTEAQRLEIMRNQFLAKTGGWVHRRDTHETTRVYNKEIEATTAAGERESFYFCPGGNKEEDESNEEWDAKSWDDADLELPGVSAFAEEEEEEEATELAPVVPVVKKAVNGKMEDKKEEGEKTLRSPICCIMGHVDSGKTKLLDCIRRTKVQNGEAGGITQQIGATYIPADNIRERTKELKADAKLNVPGLLVIDTPGHESFKNLRSRGSGLCDIAILVVDIMHGLEPQTIESLNLLRVRNTEFIVALNKVDRLYGWKTCRDAPIGKAMKQQSRDVHLEFNHRLTQIITQFKEQGLNTELYSKNKERGETYSIVPTSAISGEGIPEMLLLLVQWAQKTMIDKLTYNNKVQCTVLEVKVIEGLGTTIDVVLVNGVLHEGDEIVEPIHSRIRSLLTPHPMKELRVKGAYIHHKEIKAAQGIKIIAQNLEHAVVGTALYAVELDDDVEEIKKSVMDDMNNVMSRIDTSGEGVYVQASTLGSLEALLDFLKTPAVSIPVSGIAIGPVHKKDVMKASVMLEKKKEFAAILAFDVKVTPEAQEHADDIGVKIYIADIIYHLFDQFKAYIDHLKEEKKREAVEDAVFPCVLQIIQKVFNKRDPIILGVEVIEGILKESVSAPLGRASTSGPKVIKVGQN